MEQEQVLPTAYKSKIPQTLSWPVGAKTISGALSGVPQFSEISVEFRFWNQLARHHGTSTPYRVIEAGYSGPYRSFSASKAIMENPRFQARWTVSIDAVPRGVRHRVQERIVSEALPAIRSWLVKNTHALDRDGGHGIAFLYDELEDKLICSERASIEWQTARAK
jgi:hypothetical protein